MEQIKEVIVEFLRNGPAHNQLLSPLTNYMVLCGDHESKTVNVPFEHRQLLHHLSFLRYTTQKNEIRKYEIDEMGGSISSLLEKIPGLTSSLANKKPANSMPLHIRLMISASELALLPFELVNTPNGAPGAGQPLLLQSQRTVCLTRKIRRVANCNDYWRSAPKVLFIAASPADMSVPVEAHLLALHQAVNPWVRSSRNAQFDEKEIERNLVFLPNASLASIEEVCKKHQFTHIHILAHGGKVEHENSQQCEYSHYGLILHNSYDPNKAEVVTGLQLVTALKSYKKIAEHGISEPVMVSITSCDSGNIGTVVEAGASVAHQLHEGGIPMVIASQFPLSKAGSVIFVDTFYKEILLGTDPRLVLTDLRRKLSFHLKDYHDWASLVIYDAFPTDISYRQLEIKIEQANRSIMVALDSADYAMSTDFKENGEKSLNKLRGGIECLEDYIKLIEETDDCYLEAIGKLAGAKKRHAQVLFSMYDPDTKHDNYLSESSVLLQEAMELYELIFKKNLTSYWAITQYLSLYAVLSSLKTNKNSLKNFCPYNVSQLIGAANLAAEIELNHKAPLHRAWAHSSLAELEILKALFNSPEEKDKAESVEANQKRVKMHLDTMLKMGNSINPAIYSNIMQLKRYKEWYGMICNEKFNSCIEHFLDIIEKQPEVGKYAWKGD